MLPIVKKRPPLPPKTHANKISVKCRNCGFEKTTYRKTYKCEYCGTITITENPKK